jgi:hypothetical protein
VPPNCLFREIPKVLNRCRLDTVAYTKLGIREAAEVKEAWSGHQERESGCCTSPVVRVSTCSYADRRERRSTHTHAHTDGIED